MPGVGSTTAQRALDHMMAAADPIRALGKAPSPPRAGDSWRAFVETVTDLYAGSAGWPAELESARLWYEPHLERIHEDAATRRADLIQLEQIACGYPSRERFLTEVTLDPPDATSDQAGVPMLDEDYLILSTIHSAKGQEWKSVFVLNVVDGCIPSDLATGTTAEIEEERRLLYVAMTRAKDDLHLIVPQRFFTHGQSTQGDRHVYASRTRFIPDGLSSLNAARYAELQCTSHFSFLHGASSCEELFDEATRLGIEALAITDRNSLAGIVRAHEAAKATGVSLIVGCRLDLTDGMSILVYPADRPAYARLCRLLSLGKKRGGKGLCHLDWSDVVAYPTTRSPATERLRLACCRK